MSIRVLLVDDHPLFREGARVAIDSAEGMAVVGEASSGEQALAMLADGTEADVVLLDLLLDGASGVDTARRLTGPRVLIVSASQDDDAVITSLRAGARGYLVKGAPRAELLRAIETVAAGGAVFSAQIADRLAAYFGEVHGLAGRAAFPELTEREREVLDLVARGESNRRIARALVLSEKTVRNHISHIFAKLGVTDRTAAAVRARDAGLGS